MKRIFVSKMVILSWALFASAEKVSLSLSNAKVSTAVDAISQVSNLNIVWDKDAAAKRDKIISVSVSKPMDSINLLNLILSQNGLILVKDGKQDVFFVKEADEFAAVFPMEAVSLTGVEPFLKLVDYIKSIKTDNATFEYNQSTYSIFYRDAKENVLKVKIFADSYVKYLVDVSQKQRDLFEKKGKPARKEYKMSYDDYKSIETEILDALSSYGRVFYDKASGKIVIIDFNENLQKVTPLISRKLKTRIVSKCFYVRELEPGEIYNNIKYSELSEVGSITFKFKSVDIATIDTKSGQPPQVLQVPKQLKTGEQVDERQTDGLATATQQPTTTQQIIRGDYSVSKLPRICISDYPEVVDKIKYKYSDVLLERPYQVQIEARIVEVSSDSIRDLGIQWGGSAVSGHLTVSGTNSASAMLGSSRYAVDFPANINTTIPPQGFSLGFIYGGLSNFIDVRLSALQKIGKTKLLSAPKVLTSDGETAVIRQGYEIPYITGATATTPGNVQFKNAVMQLKVTPFTFIDGNILLNIEISKDEPDYSKVIQNVPPIITKTIISRVSVKDGQVLVIGGILEKKESEINTGVPGLMNIPILGSLFKNNYKQANSTELLVFISPKIVYE